jgi:hypothetical protein
MRKTDWGASPFSLPHFFRPERRRLHLFARQRANVFGQFAVAFHNEFVVNNRAPSGNAK